MAVVLVATVAESVEEAFRKPHPPLPAVHDGRRNSYANVPIPLVGFIMVSQKLEFCIELVKMAVVFVAAVAESLEEAFRKPQPALPVVHDGRRNSYANVPIPLVGFM
ncbi:hypothetical protein HID58_011512 [Brassica napus]|uniref:Uncharacterized protein n=8 Tax=Brassica TaxID=3705 RepID=A0ABQ8DYE7_BRANA|nr:hypothetical protein HID58_011512 [Brassica napus]